ncbi:hypothetical protein N7532_006681 [Penicillium argentinense]|uniref:Cytochrome P450 n=1 Tax=Penicillium argentinense TaxID=1131581 RepID=A0A9W9FG94_9EURO|nr:uncharacterized protein N7532_006681 [Penicillium argentinense]KAJ5099680.1 hypothetical protein N7532_006681 [Penicillium argentinense]
MAGLLTGPFLGAALLFFLFFRKWNSGLDHIPLVKYNSYLPDILNRIIYYPKAWLMIQRGYELVWTSSNCHSLFCMSYIDNSQYKESPFRMLTGDGEVVVLPTKYLDELRYMVASDLSSLHAQYENALGDYTNIVISSYLPATTIRKCLNPSLARVIPWIIDELQDAFQEAMPDCEDDWVAIEPHDVFVRLIVRATSRVGAGHVLRRNEKWIQAASNYSVNVGITILLLRPLPNFLRPFVAPFLPSVRQINQQLRYVKQLFAPMVNERRVAEAANDPTYKKPDDFLQWMMDGAEDEQDFDPELLAHHMLLIMSLAITHTSSIALTHTLYDLIARPEYQAPLREEVRRTLQSGWEKATKASFDAQRRLDSFMRESQRFNPPGDLSMHRIVMHPLTLSDGIVLPRGTHICFPSGPMTRDSTFIDDPNAFDGFRWCRDPNDRNALALTKKIGDPDDIDSEKLQPLSRKSTNPGSYVTITPATMHFGFGRQSCPGRFFASYLLKAILSRILMDYEFKFAKDQAGWRPANLYVGEHIFPNTHTPVLLRKRQVRA